MNAQQETTTLSILSVLVAFYCFVFYFGVKNTHEFLVKQKRYVNLLLTAFYLVSIATCLCRIVQYVLLITIYLLEQRQNTAIFIYFDMVSSTLMLSVGCVMVLFNISLTHGVQLSSGQRHTAPSIACMLCPTLAVVTLVPLVSMVVPQTHLYTYYVISAMDLGVAAGLFLSLVQMLSAMS